MTIAKVAKEQALTRAVFHERLREWVAATADDETRDPTVGPEELVGQHLGRTPWVFVESAGILYCLHADCRRSAVCRYLELVDGYGDDLSWTVVESQRGKRTALAYGPDLIRIQRPSFYLYAVKPQD